LTFQPAIGVQLTDRLSAGANFGLGIGLFDGLFVGSSKATNAYGARGTVGMNFDVDPCTRIGAYYQSKQSYTFEDAIILQPFAGLPGLPLDVPLDLPPNVAIGISNNSMAGGRLLVAADFVYKFWQEATLFNAIYENQFCVQLGAQYTTNRAKLRLGYVWAENPMVDVPGNVIGGITPPGAVNALQYIQGLAPNINEHRISGGIGVPNLLPGVDLDLFAGGMFNASDTFGVTSASVESYYVGGGLTWRFRRGSGCCIAPDEWCCPNDIACSRANGQGYQTMSEQMNEQSYGQPYGETNEQSFGQSY
jgi:long-chain fatty acid transport protein